MDEKYLRAYLLGQLPEFASERLETRALDEEDFFMTLKSVEDDLFDEFARNRLSAEEREAFIEKYGENHERLVFARALAGKSAKVVSFPTARRWTAGLAAAAVLVLAVGTMMMRPQQAPAPAVAPVVLTTPATAPADLAVTANISIGASRAAEKQSAIAVPANATRVELRARLNPADKFELYSVELRSSSNNVVWGDAAVRASNVNGDLVVTASVPANVLSTGSYEIAVRGIAPNARPEELGFATIEIQRMQ